MNPMADYLHPEFLSWRPWVLALACLHALLWAQQFWAQRRQFTPAMLSAYGPGLSLWRGLAKAALWAAAAWWLCLALAVPLGPPETVEQGEPGADVVLAVDVSSSMLAQDIQPNRLEALKATLANFIERLQGDRVGLVAFAGEAVVACPLTTDLDTALLFLSKLDPDSVPRDGTGLGPALKLAQDGFKNSGSRGRLIVLATDGEDTANSDALAQARRLKDAGISFLTVGLGSTQGAMIPGRRDVFGRVYAKLYQGQPVVTRLDRAGLQKVSVAGGGDYVEVKDAQSLSHAVAKVRQLKQGLGAAKSRTIREPLYQAPLGWALLLLFIESLLSARSRGWLRLGSSLSRRFGRHAQKAALGLFLGSLPLSLAAAWDGGRSDYNAGNQAFRQKDYQGAVQRYEASLQAGPGAPDAEANLALAKRMLEEKEEKKDGKQEQGSKDQQGQGQQEKGDKQGQSQGQGKQPGPGQPQGPGPGQSQGQPKPAQAGQSRAQAALNSDKAQAMMNQLRLDQRRYAANFNPLKKRQPKQAQDPMQQVLERMGMASPKQPEAEGGNGDVKDW